MQLRELTSKGKKRMPENIISVPDEVGFKILNRPKPRWEVVREIKKSKK
jgi:hypothetical protein